MIEPPEFSSAVRSVSGCEKTGAGLVVNGRPQLEKSRDGDEARLLRNFGCREVGI